MHLYRKDPRAGCPRRRSTFVGHVWNGMLTFRSTHKPTPDVSSPNHRPNQHFRSSNKPTSGVWLASHRPNKHIRSTHKPTSGVSSPEKHTKNTIKPPTEQQKPPTQNDDHTRTTTTKTTKTTTKKHNEYRVGGFGQRNSGRWRKITMSPKLAKSLVYLQENW